MIDPKTNEIADRTPIIQSCLSGIKGDLGPLRVMADENSLWTFAAKMGGGQALVCRIRASKNGNER